jgi:WD40 repeat protein/ABC-type iron transport system FetAB ATPase subunit
MVSTAALQPPGTPGLCFRMTTDPKTIRIFISSPSDVMKEREIAERVIARLDGIWRTYVRLQAVRWEHAHYDMHQSFQEAIGDISVNDLVCGILWKRIGSPLSPALFRREDGSSYESGTAYEIEAALACGGKPKVYLFRKEESVWFAAETVDAEKAQHQALNRWWNHTVLDAAGHFVRGYESFATADEFERRFESVLEAFLQNARLIPSGAAWDIASKGSPYPGLVPYDDAYSAVFFGRALATAEALHELKSAALREMPAVIMVGPSGSGKSSLVRAGLCPHFSGAQIQGVDAWRQVLLEPAQDPLRVLADRLYGVLPALAQGPQASPDLFVALARQSPEGAAQAVSWALEQLARAEQQRIGGGALPTVRLLFVLDQLETVLEGPHRREVAAFVRALVESQSTWFIGTLRSDRYADLQLDPDFLSIRRRSALFDLPPPGASEFADIIKGPARAAGLVFEARDGASLAKTIEATVGGADALPLLQMTLARLFDARNGNILTFSAYESMGGLEGAIAARAEEVVEKASPAAQQTLDAILRSLVADMDENGQLTIRTPDQSAVAPDAASRELVDKMTEARLLVRADTGVRVAHEALLRRWKRATDSPALQPQAIRLRRQIGPNFDMWRKTRLDGDLLQAGTALTDASAITLQHPGAFPPDLEEFVRRSAQLAQERALAEKRRAQAEARRARWLTRAALAVATIFVLLSGFIYFFYDRAVRSEIATRQQASTAAYASALQQRDFDEAALAYLAQAARLDPQNTGIGRAILMLLANRYWPSLAVPDLHHHDLVNSARFSPDGTKIVTASADKTARLWDAQTGAPIGLPLSHADVVFGAMFDATGERVVTWSNDNTAQVWDAHTGAPIGKPMRHQGWVTSARFSPDGTKVVSGSFDCTAMLWDARTGAPLGPPLVHAGWVDSVEFTPDGARVLTAADSHQRADPSLCGTSTGLSDGAQFWDAVTFKSVGKPMRHSSGVRTARISPDGTRVVTASNDGSARLWDAATGHQIGDPMLHQNRAYTAEFSPNGSRVVTASTDKTARVWDGFTGKPITPPLPHQRDVRSAFFSPDGTRVVTASDGETAQVWNAKTGRPLGAPLRHEGVVVMASFDPKGLRLVTASDDHTARIWDARTGQPRPPPLRHGGAVRGATYSPDGNLVVTSSRDGTAMLWDAHDGHQLGRPLRHDGPVNTAMFNHSGSQVITASDDRTARIWDAMTGEPIGSPLPHTAPVTGAWFAPDGKRTVTVTNDGYGFIWQPDTNRNAGIPFYQTDQIRMVAFKADGTRFVTAGNDHAAIIRDAATGATIGAKLRHEKAVNSVRFSPDDQWVVTASDDQTVRVWNSVTGEERRAPFRLGGPVFDAKFSPDGKWIAAAAKDGAASVWDIDTGRLVGALLRHDGPVVTLCFSRDSRLLVTASADGTARLWSVESGRPFGMLLLHQGSVNTACFSPDGNGIVTASDDGTARLWSIPDVRGDQMSAIADLAEVVGRLRVDDRGSVLPLAARDEAIERLRTRAASQVANDYDRVLNDLLLPLSASPPQAEQRLR